MSCKFADDNFTIKFHQDLKILIPMLESSLNNTSKWLQDSGLTVNKDKTEVCLFSRRDVAPQTVVVGGAPVFDWDPVSSPCGEGHHL